MTSDARRRRRDRVCRRLTLCVLAGVIAGCGSADKTSPPASVLTTLALSLSNNSVVVGQTVTASVSGRDQFGASMGIGAVVWTSTNSGIASVSSAGVVTALAPGQAQVVATVGAKSASADVTVIPPPVASVTVTPGTASVTVGSTQQLIAATLDGSGTPLTGRAIAWTSSDTTKAKVSASGLVTAIAVGAVTISASSEGKSGVANLTILPAPVATVTVSPNPASVNAGATQQLTATLVDANNNVLTGRTVTWSTSDASKATVTSDGLVAGVAAGAVTITATSEGKSGTSAVTVIFVPVATVAVAPSTVPIQVGTTTTLAATAKDANGNALSGRSFTWTSSSPSVSLNLSVGSSVTASGASAGSSTITVTSEGKTATSIVTVLAAPPVTILGVSPATIVPGAGLTIAGSNFSPTAASNTVLIGGVAAIVNSASATQLSVTVGSSYPCQATNSTTVSVSANGWTATTTTTLQVAAQQAMAVGQSISFLTDQAVRCNELSVTSGRYLISLFNTSTIPTSGGTVSLKGASASAVPPSSAPGVTQQRALGTPSRSPAFNAALASDANARAHLTILEQNRQVYAQFRRSASLESIKRQANQSRARAQAVVVPPTVGAQVTLKWRGLASTSCDTFTDVTARVVSVTAHGIVLEDNASPTAGQIDPELVSLGQLFETRLYPIEANFGDINAWDVAGALDNPGRVLMLFTPGENVPFQGGGIVLGHVSACDLFPTTLQGAAGSNQSKIFYARVPTTLVGTAYTQDTKAAWFAQMPGVIVHEAKHITSFAERINRDADTFEDSWLEEATAQIAPEIYSRSVYPATVWKGNTTYASSLFCDARIGNPICPNGQFLMQNHFNFLRDYYAKTQSKSILSPGSSDGDIYGSAWMFVRWLIDQYGGATESVMLKGLVQEPHLSGVANVSARTGQTFGALLADWSLAVVADDYPGLAPPVGAKYTFPSWNMRSIWSGYASDFNISASPLQELLLSFGAFNVTGALPGGGMAILELSGAQTAKQLLDMSDLPAGTTIRMSILRVQ